MHSFKIQKINVRDELSDVLMKSWYSEDPFPGWINKLTTNKPQFAAFLTQQYSLDAGIDISYKRSASKEPGKE